MVAQKKAPFRPLYDVVLLEPLDASKFTPGGLQLPDSASVKPSRGRVIAVGGGPMLSSGECGPMPVKVGDEILFAKGTTFAIQVDGKEFTLIKVMHIIGVIDC